MVSYSPQLQDNILVDKPGSARLNDFGFTEIVSLNCVEISAARFKGSHRWMAPELVKTDNSCLSTNQSTNASDVFALGMVTFEVSNTSRGRMFQCFITVLRLPSGLHGASAVSGVKDFSSSHEAHRWRATAETSQGKEVWTFRHALGDHPILVGSRGEGETSSGDIRRVLREGHPGHGHSQRTLRI